MNGYLSRLIERTLPSLPGAQPALTRRAAPVFESRGTVPEAAPALSARSEARAVVERMEAPCVAPLSRAAFMEPPKREPFTVEKSVPVQTPVQFRIETSQADAPVLRPSAQPTPEIGKSAPIANALKVADRFMERFTVGLLPSEQPPSQVPDSPAPPQDKAAEAWPVPLAPPAEAPAARTDPRPLVLPPLHAASPVREAPPATAQQQVVIGTIEVHVDAPQRTAPAAHTREIIHRVVHTGGAASRGPSLERSARFGLGQI